MMPRLKALILRLLHEHRVMTMATLRPDGWPQATMVGYLNDGFLLYCFVARSTQKFANIQRDPRVSIAIGSDAANPMQVRGLSLAGHASEVNDRSEFDEIAALRLQKFPDMPPCLRRWRGKTATCVSRRRQSPRGSRFCASRRTSSRCWTTSTASATASSSPFRNAISMCISRPGATPGTRSTASSD
jgi:general stress protein 26